MLHLSLLRRRPLIIVRRACSAIDIISRVKSYSEVSTSFSDGSAAPLKKFYLWYVWSSHIARVWINRVRLPILFVVSSTGKMIFSLSPSAPENLVSREGFGSLVPRQPAHLHIQAESGAYLPTGFLPRSEATSIYLCSKPPYAIGSVPSLSRHATAYR